MNKLALYSKIKDLSDKGFSQRKIANKLGVSRNTVSKYLDNNGIEMAEWLASTKHRKKKLDIYQDLILSWLKEHSDLTAAQVQDWLKERNYGIFAGSTVSRYVHDLRTKYKIIKKTERRQYEAVPEMPPGFQGQVDFGQTYQETVAGSKIKLYFFAFVLSHSRYKYMQWQKHPFTTLDLIDCLRNTFNYLGGKPKQIVYDQDRIIVVSENNGDIIFTKEFQSFKESEHFIAVECRGFDPETKGKIESVVKFIKHSFAYGRIFKDLSSWQEEALAWLERRGNGQQHNTTKKIPAEVFKEEKKYLQPVTNYLPNKDDKLQRIVRKDNTIMYRSNRYSVPLGSYDPHGHLVILKIISDRIVIIDQLSGAVMAKHKLSERKGQLIQNNSHLRDRNLGISELSERTIEKFTDHQKAGSFVDMIKAKYPRYIRDQLQVIIRSSNEYSNEQMDKALAYCFKNRLISATDFKSVIQKLMDAGSVKSEIPEVPISNNTKQKLASMNPEIRSLDAYSEILGCNHDAKR